MEEKEFTAWDMFIIGLNMFVLGMLLVRITDGSSVIGGSVPDFQYAYMVLHKISIWFTILWMIGLVGIATCTYMKNRKSGMTVIRSFTRLTLGYVLLEIPLGLYYYYAINVRM